MNAIRCALMVSANRRHNALAAQLTYGALGTFLASKWSGVRLFRLRHDWRAAHEVIDPCTFTLKISQSLAFELPFARNLNR